MLAEVRSVGWARLRSCWRTFLAMPMGRCGGVSLLCSFGARFGFVGGVGECYWQITASITIDMKIVYIYFYHIYY